MKVSVVVVTFNQQNTIRETLLSILRQNCDFPYEILVADDASSDNTPQIVRQLQQQFPGKIQLFQNQTNKGILNNYYDCMIKCRGEYICDLAGDDVWIDPDKLSLQASLLDNNNDVVLCHTNWICRNVENGKSFSPWNKQKYPFPHSATQNSLTQLILTHPPEPVVHLCTAMFRRDAFIKLYEQYKPLFRNPQYFVEDLQLVTLLSTVGKFRFIDRVSLEYRIHDHSVSNSPRFDKIFDLYFGSVKLTRQLELVTKTPHRSLTKTYRRFFHFLLMQTFHASDSGRKKLLMQEATQWDFQPSLKSKIILLISSNKRAWNLTRQLWQFLRNLSKPKR